MTAERQASFAKKAADLGVAMEETSISLSALLATVSPTCLPIVLVNINQILDGTTERRPYVGHFFVVTGHTPTHVLVHNQLPSQVQRFQAIPYDVFDAARKHPLTDEDIVVLFPESKL